MFKFLKKGNRKTEAQIQLEALYQSTLRDVETVKDTMKKLEGLRNTK